MIGRFQVLCVGRAELPSYKFLCYVISLTGQKLRDYRGPYHQPLTMKFIRHLRAPRCIIARHTPNFSPYGINSRRMASFYNVDIAGLTDEQVEVRKPLCKTMGH
jgi:hypothetical protein